MREGWPCRASPSESGAAPEVVLTREAGKNGDLARRLAVRSISTLELPLVETGEGPDRDELQRLLQRDEFDYIIITSPESASVFLTVWLAAGQPEVKVAVVGDGTGQHLVASGYQTLRPVFVPTKANAVSLAAELPFDSQNQRRVLYPASAKAGPKLQNGLAARGVEVVRLNTYTTRPVSSLDPDRLQEAKKARVLSIASPSAIKAWVQLAGSDSCPAVACIGTTSSDAAVALGLTDVFTTDAPGMDGFVQSIEDALLASSTS